MNQPKTRYSVELMHIYADQTYSAEQTTGAVLANQLVRELGSEEFTTCILIDNYNPEVSSLDIGDFLTTAEEHAGKIDYWAFEAAMAPYERALMGMVRVPSVYKRYRGYIDKRGKLPCSFLTAVWYLLRLGILIPDTGTIKSRYAASFTPASRLVNVLPSRFEKTEQHALELISSIQLIDTNEAITNHYFTSPLESLAFPDSTDIQ